MNEVTLNNLSLDELIRYAQWSTPAAMLLAKRVFEAQYELMTSEYFQELLAEAKNDGIELAMKHEI